MTRDELRRHLFDVFCEGEPDSNDASVMSSLGGMIDAYCDARVLAEREACAKLCEKQRANALRDWGNHAESVREVLAALAAKIRRLCAPCPDCGTDATGNGSVKEGT